MKNIKKYFLIFAFLAIIPIALAYGISPDWFASTLLGINDLDTNIVYILRAIMCFYLALSFFWLYSAFKPAYRNPVLLSIVMFTGGLVVGRLLSYFIDGEPQPILLLYIGLEFLLTPIAYLVYKLPE